MNIPQSEVAATDNPSGHPARQDDNPRFHKTQLARRETVAEYGYTVIYDQLAEGGYQVLVPVLPGIVTYDRTLEEARQMAPQSSEISTDSPGTIEGDHRGASSRGIRSNQ